MNMNIIESPSTEDFINTVFKIQKNRTNTSTMSLFIDAIYDTALFYAGGTTYITEQKISQLKYFKKDIQFVIFCPMLNESIIYIYNSENKRYDIYVFDSRIVKCKEHFNYSKIYLYYFCKDDKDEIANVYTSAIKCASTDLGAADNVNVWRYIYSKMLYDFHIIIYKMTVDKVLTIKFYENNKSNV